MFDVVIDVVEVDAVVGVVVDVVSYVVVDVGVDDIVVLVLILDYLSLCVLILIRKLNTYNYAYIDIRTYIYTYL